MTASTKLAALNDFLDAVYGAGTRLSGLLATEGRTPEQLATLRERHMDQLVDEFIAAIAERFAEYNLGDRKLHVLTRRFGLDRAPRETLAVIGQHLGVSRERVRQIEEPALRRCRSAKNRLRWQEALRQAALALLAGIMFRCCYPAHSMWTRPPHRPCRLNRRTLWLRCPDRALRTRR